MSQRPVPKESWKIRSKKNLAASRPQKHPFCTAAQKSCMNIDPNQLLDQLRGKTRK